MLVSEAKPLETGLDVTFGDASQSCFDYFWLRDNARDSESFNHASHQRELFTAHIDADIHPQSVTLEGGAVVIQWPGMAEPVKYDGEFLHSYRSPQAEYLYLSATLWDKAKLEQPPALDFDELSKDQAQQALVSQLQTTGFSIIKNCPLDKTSVETVANTLGYVRETIFGGVWQFEDNQEMADSAFTSDALRPHNDGTYSHDAPGLQLLLCIGRNATGGESVLVDGFNIAEQLKAQDPDLYRDMTRIELTGIYKGDGHVLRASRPVFRENQQGELLQMTFNNYDRDTIRLNDSDMRRAYEGIIAIDKLLNLEENQWRYVLEEGEMMVFDNWRLLHGRTSYQGHRVMAGTYVNREDFESKLRGFDLL